MSVPPVRAALAGLTAVSGKLCKAITTTPTPEAAPRTAYSASRGPVAPAIAPTARNCKAIAIAPATTARGAAAESTNRWPRAPSDDLAPGRLPTGHEAAATRREDHHVRQHEHGANGDQAAPT